MQAALFEHIINAESERLRWLAIFSKMMRQGAEIKSFFQLEHPHISDKRLKLRWWRTYQELESDHYHPSIKHVIVESMVQVN